MKCCNASLIGFNCSAAYKKISCLQPFAVPEYQKKPLPNLNFFKKTCYIAHHKRMKKLTAILLLSIFTFNMVGYQMLYNFMADKSDTALELALDTQRYNDADLICIKQPTNLPYYTDTKEFQRIDGEVEMDGIKYKYVKCRIYNGNLEMLCIPNTAKMKIEQSKNDYAKVAHDFQQDNSKKKSGSDNKSFQKSLSEFEELQNFTFGNNDILHTSFVLCNTALENKHYFNSVEQPPDAA